MTPAEVRRLIAQIISGEFRQPDICCSVETAAMIMALTSGLAVWDVRCYPLVERRGAASKRNTA